MLIRLILISLFPFLVSCAEEEEIKEPTDEHCSFKMSVSYNLGRNPTNDFIAQNISGSGSVDESTCPCGSAAKNVLKIPKPKSAKNDRAND
jgi:hypothetical protein